MTYKGFSHIGLSTLDLDKTRKFYESVLGVQTGRRRHDKDRVREAPSTHLFRCRT